MDALMRLRLPFVGFLTLITLNIFAQKSTSVRGQVTDSKTKDALPYVNVQFDGTTIGATSDIDGNFYLETKNAVSKIKISYVGYRQQIIPIQSDQANTVNIKLDEGSNDLQEVVVKVEKYRNKGNPAVELIKKVIDNKDKNRKESIPYYSYNKYEKIQFSINNVTNKMRNNFLFRRAKFVFENADTNKASGKVNLPLFLQEKISDIVYRKDPKASKEYIRGERSTNLGSFINSEGIGNYVQNMYQDINFYDNTIELMTVQFVSPISPLAPTIYRFYIQDTSIINNTPIVHMYFAPRQKSDLAFMGHLWVALDSTYSIRKIEVGVPKDINLNWVNELQLAQEYEWVEAPQYLGDSTRALMLTKDEIFMDFGVFEGDSSRSLLGNKTTSYKKYVLNTPLPDSLFTTAGSILREDSYLKQNEQFWVENRHDTLKKTENGIYTTVDSLNKFRPFKRLMNIFRLAFEGYNSVGGFDVGPVNTFYSFNDIEGFRLRLGGRTNLKFSNKLMLEGFAAYGFKDEKWKGYAGMRYNFSKDQMMRFPYNQLKAWYTYDVRIPGQQLQFVQEDNFLLSFKRGVNDKMFYTSTAGIEYLKENRNGFYYAFSAKHIEQNPTPALLTDYTDQTKPTTITKTTELGLMLRYAPNDKFYEGATYRIPIFTKYPIIQLNYNAGIKGILNSQYNYHEVKLMAEKIFYISPFGISDVIVEGGRIFGQAAYPLLTVHRANQTYAYQMESYNLMNFMEFVSDKYASVNIYHNFGGVFFNRIPLLKKLKWREAFSFKALWGGLDAENTPTVENNLLRFPLDANGQKLTYTLEKEPYIEASVGISNILRFVRVDYVRRLNYLNHPGVTAWGIRTRVKFDF
jgi:Family of unknown function (DUF5686)/CarboxypepD_reg-like domain